MTQEQAEKCHLIIHTATVAAGAIGAIPIPCADAIPICGFQITMIISLGKVFDLTIGRSVAESIASVTFAATAGRFIVSNLLKLIPGIGSIVGAATAVGITEAMGWLVAGDFHRISVGEKPEKIGKAACDIQSCYNKVSKGH